MEDGDFSGVRLRVRGVEPAFQAHLDMARKQQVPGLSQLQIKMGPR